MKNRLKRSKPLEQSPTTKAVPTVQVKMRANFDTGVAGSLLDREGGPGHHVSSLMSDQSGQRCHLEKVVD